MWLTKQERWRLIRGGLFEGALLLVSLPSLLLWIVGGVFLVTDLWTGGYSDVLPNAALFLGGLAGRWGAETLRRRPGHRTRLAILAAPLGIIVFLALLYEAS